MKISKAGRRAAFGIAGVAAAATAVAMVATAPAQAEGTVLGADSSKAIAGEYIVKFSDASAAKDSKSVAAEYGAEVQKNFNSINGASIKASEAEAKELASDSKVDYIQANLEHQISGTQDDPPSWGLDRVDQDTPEGDGAYTYPDSAGEGVTTYVIDTGVDYEHPDFGDRASSGIDTVDGDDDAMDGHGHGTHVGGTMVGESYGLAKSASVVGVRVLDDQGSGTTEGVVEGVDWVAENAEENSVANMSLGGPKDQALDDAVTAAIDAGVSFAVAAGNESSDACEVSPGGAPDAITVAASGETDNHAEFSNFGECVDIYAPGEDIVSAVPGGGEEAMSGTSMASPHAAGAAALYLGENAGAAPADVSDALVEGGQADAIEGAPEGTANVLLNVAFLNA